MTGKVFVDTNVLIYAHDLDAGRKRAVAAEIVQELWETSSGVLSIQVLQEFYVNVTRKIPQPLPAAQAREIIEHYTAWPVVTPTAESVLRASRLEERHRISFWDALIVQAARESGAVRILTEDFNHGQKIDGILIENPFLA